MKIRNITITKKDHLLNKVFKTALRETKSLSEIVVILELEDGLKGCGAACNCEAITGSTPAGMRAIIEEKIFPRICGMDILSYEHILSTIQSSVAHNYGAKAAVDLAVYDLLSQFFSVPLYKFLGGYRTTLMTDLTLSIDTPEKMAEEAKLAVEKGFSMLKIKVGKDPKGDIVRVKKIREAVGDDIELRLDANQAWKPKQAVIMIEKLSEYDIALIEQPVPSFNIEGLRFVTSKVSTPIMADESIFHSHDAFTLLANKAVDYLNIKLMKCGGIYEALKIVSLAEAAGVECMLGCMMESTTSIAYAIHLAAAKKNITKIDLDSPLYLLNPEPMSFIEYIGPEIKLLPK